MTQKISNELNKEAVGPVGVAAVAALALYANSQRNKKKKAKEELEKLRAAYGLEKEGELTMWQKSFVDELSKASSAHAQHGVDEALPTTNAEVVHTSDAERDLAVNMPAGAGKYFGNVERNPATNNAKEAVQEGVDRNLPTTNAEEAVGKEPGGSLPTNYAAAAIRSAVERNLATN